MSGAFAGTIPAEIPPLDPEEEKAIVSTLLTELNEKFCVELDPNPSFDRSIPSGRIKKLCDTLKKFNLTKKDTVVIDSLSNTAYLGTDEDGLPIPAAKCNFLKQIYPPSMGKT